VDDDERAGREAGRRWAHALIEAKGMKWLESVEIGAGTPVCDAFKRCVDPSGTASERDIFEALFNDDVRSAEYIAAFIKSAVIVLQRQRDQPH
jgi:hypothetical protein